MKLTQLAGFFLYLAIAAVGVVIVVLGAPAGWIVVVVGAVGIILRVVSVWNGVRADVKEEAAETAAPSFDEVMLKSRADAVWNRAAKYDGGVSPLDGDRALAAILEIHTLIVSGGLEHAGTVVTAERFVAAADGFIYFRNAELSEVLTEAAQSLTAKGEAKATFAALDGRYKTLVPSDATLVAMFESRFRADPAGFEPVT